MPGLGPLPDAAQIILAVSRGAHNGVGWSNVGYFQYTGPAPQVADLASLGTAIGNAWNTNFAPMCHANVTMTEVDLTDLTNRSAASTKATGLAHAGSRAGTDNPNNVACVISWLANRRYRGGHARSYLPAGVQADITSGRLWSTTFQNAMTAAANAYRTAVNAFTYPSATVHLVTMNFYTHDPVTKAKQYVIPPVPYTITGALTHGRVDTQRLRLGKETP